jgi:phospholipase/carboxylesterase
MNRIPQLEEMEHPSIYTREIQSELQEKTRPERRRWHILWPLHFEPGYAYPLLIWLHGGGADEKQLLPVMNLMETRNFVSMAPCGTQIPEGCRSDVCFWDQGVEGVEEAAERVSACLREASRRARIDRSRIYLAGYADGGTMALRLAFRDPDRFAGVATIQGEFPTNDRPLQAFPKTAKLRVLLAYGREASRYHSQLVSRDMRILHAAGVRLDVRQYETDDSPVDIMFHDLNAWIMGPQPQTHRHPDIRLTSN